MLDDYVADAQVHLDSPEGPTSAPSRAVRGSAGGTPKEAPGTYNSARKGERGFELGQGTRDGDTGDPVLSLNKTPTNKAKRSVAQRTGSHRGRCEQRSDGAPRTRRGSGRRVGASALGALLASPTSRLSVSRLQLDSRCDAWVDPARPDLDSTEPEKADPTYDCEANITQSSMHVTDLLQKSPLARPGGREHLEKRIESLSTRELDKEARPVSYTHLTLPTIYSV